MNNANDDAWDGPESDVSPSPLLKPPKEEKKKKSSAEDGSKKDMPDVSKLTVEEKKEPEPKVVEPEKKDESKVEEKPTEEPVEEAEPEIKAPFEVMKLDEMPQVPEDSPVHVLLPPDFKLKKLAAACEDEATKDFIVMPESAVVTPSGILLTLPSVEEPTLA